MTARLRRLRSSCTAGEAAGDTAGRTAGDTAGRTAGLTAGRPAGRVGAAIAAAISIAVLASGCSVLGLSSEEPTAVPTSTSAAPLATGGDTAQAAVTVPTLQTGGTVDRASPTPWASLTSSAPPPTSEAPLTAATTTRTLTFSSFSSATKPTVAAPSLSATPPPACYRAGTCKALDSAAATGGTVLVVNPPGGSDTVAILTAGGKPVDALSLARVGSPTVACSGSNCLVQGGGSGVYFGSVVTIGGGRLRAVPGSPVSTRPLRLQGSGSGIWVAGIQRFDDYGLPVTDAPVAVRTWALSGGRLVSTGCASPRLYTTPPAVTVIQHGSCSGTPQIAGYGSASAHKILSLGGFATASGNIRCAVVPGNKLACTAKSHSFPVARCTRPESSVPSALRGLRVVLPTSGAVFRDGCLGYTLIGSPATPIAYNRLAAGGGFVCEVQESGVTCTARSGHGFTLSRSALRTH